MTVTAPVLYPQRNRSWEMFSLGRNGWSFKAQKKKKVESLLDLNTRSGTGK